MDVQFQIYIANTCTTFLTENLSVATTVYVYKSKKLSLELWNIKNKYLKNKVFKNN